MATPQRHPRTVVTRPSPSPLDRLAATPTRFALDQAARLAAPAGDVLRLRWRTVARLGYAEAEVLSARPAQHEVTVGSFGLVGPGGVLPRHLTATVAAEARKRSRALHAFTDLVGGRFIGLYVMAGGKYRPAQDPAPTERALAAAAGLGTPGLLARAGVPAATVLYHAGHLASRSRSAVRLAALLAEETGMTVAITEFTGGWQLVPPAERTRLGDRLSGGQHAQLGQGAMLGRQTFDAQGRFDLRFGPLDRAGFAALLPGRGLHARVAALTRLAIGLDTGFVLNPVLRAAEIPAARLGEAALGWDSWLATPRRRLADGAEPRFADR
jgi:type VI secretion system protein ImpH